MSSCKSKPFPALSIPLRPTERRHHLLKAVILIPQARTELPLCTGTRRGEQGREETGSTHRANSPEELADTYY